MTEQTTGIEPDPVKECRICKGKGELGEPKDPREYRTTTVYSECWYCNGKGHV